MLISLLVVWVNVKISACGFVPPEKRVKSGGDSSVVWFDYIKSSLGEVQ
jgi:hypothetical protein